MHAKMWFSDVKALSAFFMFNVKTHRGDFADKNIRQVTPFIEYHPSVAQKVFDESTNEPVAGKGWIAALEVTVEKLAYLIEDTTQLVVSRQIILISDFKNMDCDENEPSLKRLAAEMNRLDMYLYIIGPQVVYEKMLNSFADIRRWSRDVKFVDETNKGLQAAKGMLKHLDHGIICDLDVGWQIFTFYKKHVLPQPFSEPLSIGNNLKLEQKSVRYIEDEQFPKVRIFLCL